MLWKQQILAPHSPSTAATATAKSPQSRPTLCDPIDGSPPGSAVPSRHRLLAYWNYVEGQKLENVLRNS